MKIGDRVTYGGRTCVLRGLDPMSVPDRRAHLEDVATGERLAVPLLDVTPTDDVDAHGSPEFDEEGLG